MIRLLFAWSLVAAAPLAAALPRAAADAAATVDAFHAALKRGDTRAAADLLDKRVTIFESGEVERSRAEYAAHHLGADAEFSAATTATVTRRMASSSGSTALVASEGRVGGSFHGRAIDLRTTETMVLARAGKDWKIVHIHWSSAKAR